MPAEHAQIKLVVWSNTLLGWPFNTVLPMPRPFGMYALLALASSTVGVFKFVAQRLLRAWRPREFYHACVEMSQTPQCLLDLVLSVTINVLIIVVLSPAAGPFWIWSACLVFWLMNLQMD